MYTNEEVLKGKWKDFKGEVQKTWGNITGDELEQTKGNMKSIHGLIQQKYGNSKEDFSTKLNNLYEKFSTEVKKDAAEITDKVKQGLRSDKEKSSYKK